MPSLHLMFGLAVRRLRVEAGYSQESFADAIGVHRNYIGTVERGETNITLDNIGRIARGLKQPIWQLLRDMESPSPAPAPTVLPGSGRREYRQPSSRPPVLRVAERRVEVREQLAGLLAELTELEAVEYPKRRGGAGKPKKKRGE